MNINQTSPEIQSCKYGKKSFSIASLHIDPNKLRSTKILINNNFQVSRGDSISKMSYYDKEDQSDQIYKLKKENNSLKIEIKQLKSQLHYFQKELESLQTQCKESESIPFPLQQQVKMKQLMKCLSQKEMEIDQLKKQNKLEQKNDQQEQLLKLKALCEVQKTKLLSSETEILMPSKATILRSLEEDNIKLVQIVQELESKLKFFDQMKKHNTIYQSKIQNQQRLIAQLQSEVREFKDRDNLFANKASQQNKTETIIQKLNAELSKLSSQCQNQQEKIDDMIESHKKNQDKYEKIIMEKDEEILNIRIKYENLNRSINDEYSEQRFKKSSRTPIFKPSNFAVCNQKPLMTDFNLSSQRSQSARNRSKQMIITKQDLQTIIKILKFHILLNQISLQDIDKYIFKDSSENEVKLKELTEQFQNSIFKLSHQQAQQLSLYLMDAEDGTETQSKQRIRSIFKTLVDNYQAPSLQDIEKYKKEIAQIFNMYDSQSIKLDLIQRYGHQIQKIQTYDLFEIFQQKDIKISKQTKEFLEAQFFQINNFQTGVFQVDQLDNLKNIQDVQ